MKGSVSQEKKKRGRSDQELLDLIEKKKQLMLERRFGTYYEELTVPPTDNEMECLTEAVENEIIRIFGLFPDDHSARLTIQAEKQKWFENTYLAKWTFACMSNIQHCGDEEAENYIWDIMAQQFSQYAPYLVNSWNKDHTAFTLGYTIDRPFDLRITKN